MTESPFPTFQDILWPTLKALDQMGGSASNEELSERVAAIMKLPDAVLDVPSKNGSLSRIDYRAGWARTHLKMIGAIDNSARGVWTLSDIGRRIGSDAEVRKLVKRERAERRKARRQVKAAAADDSDDEAPDEASEISWQDRLLAILRALDPAAFERLCQRVLRESGFTKVEVTGRTGDGGLDGAVVLRVNNLLSFHVRFQCKRYSGSVGAPEIRDFRGAMVGRADKGLFMTTGRYTKDAEREATRDGAPAIDLVDGLELCRLLKSLDLGVKVRTVEEVEPIADFFKTL